MASCLAFRYDLFARSPVSSQGICFGLEMARLDALCSSPFDPLAPVRLTDMRGDAGLGDGVILTISARELGRTGSLLLCPPRFPWCFLPCFTVAEPRDGKASLSSRAGAGAIFSFVCCRLSGRDRESGLSPKYNGRKPGGGVIIPEYAGCGPKLSGVPGCNEGNEFRSCS